MPWRDQQEYTAQGNKEGQRKCRQVQRMEHFIYFRRTKDDFAEEMASEDGLGFPCLEEPG